MIEAAVMLAVVDNQIGDEGVKALSEALAHNNSVTTIVLSGSELLNGTKRSLFLT